jgi:hypothetical protein
MKCFKTDTVIVKVLNNKERDCINKYEDGGQMRTHIWLTFALLRSAHILLQIYSMAVTTFT